MPSGEDFFNDAAVDVHEAKVAAVEAIDQLLVVEAEHVKDRRVQVVHVHPSLDCLMAELVGRAVGEALPSILPSSRSSSGLWSKVST